jgi:hypothetical protein
LLLLGLLPLAALGLSIALFRRRTGDASEAVVLGALSWSYAAALGTEALSLLHAIAFGPLLALWTMAAAALALALWRSRSRWTAPEEHLGAIRRTLLAWSLEEWILAAVLLLIGSVTLLIALVCPPNNWDSLTYHLPRIEHWIQNHTLDFYRTSIDRQLMMPGLAEVLILQLRLLSGGDRLVSLVQWLAGAGSVVLVGRIALALGAGRRGAAFARLAAATLPIGILEASTTQNDLVVSFFLLAMAERLLAWQRSRQLADAGAFAIAAGLSLAAKGTAYLIGLPFGLWFLAGWPARGPRAALPLLGCAILLLLPNLPSYSRNLAFSGSPIGTVGRDTNNAAFGFDALVVNGSRHLAVNLATQNSDYDKWLARAVEHGLSAVGLDANAPELTFPGTSFGLSTFQNDEDFAGNPAQLLLAIASFGFVVLAGPSGFPRRRYALAVAAAALIFLIGLRWQPWITRLQLPLFALAMPLAGLLPFERGGLAARRIGAAVALVLAVALIITASPPLWTSFRRPLFPPRGYVASIWAKSGNDILFAARPNLQLPYRSVVVDSALRGDSQIGLMLGGNDWEYPLWRLLHQQGTRNLRVEHVGIRDALGASAYPLGPFAPTLIILSKKDQPPLITIDGVLWHRDRQYPPFALYRRAAP